MKQTNRGKDFEGKIRAGLEKASHVSADRFADPVGGYLGVKNICDFVFYQFPTELYVECKAIYGNTLNFKSDITQNQWDGLKDKAPIRGVVAGIAVWFIEWDVTVFVPITELVKLRENGAKSLNITDIQDNKIYYIPIPGRKLKVFYDYDGIGFMKRIQEYSKELWKWGGHK